MTTNDMVEQLRTFVAREFLQDQKVELTPTTPLLELGIVNSMSIFMLLNFARKQFNIEIPPEEQTVDNLKTIESLASLLTRIQTRAR